MDELKKYTEKELRDELTKREENRKSKTHNGMYKCHCSYCGRMILSRYPTTNICDECSH